MWAFLNLEKPIIVLVIMKFNQSELQELSTPSGGKFAVDNLGEAYDFCRRIALGHYENFPVASILLPESKRHHIFAVYSFARIADDIADEIPNVNKEFKLNILDEFLLNLKEYNVTSANNPILYALSNSINELRIDFELFERLILAFKMDANFEQAETLDDLLNYCKFSANPVGEIVLSIFEQNIKQNVELSDYICTALQLTNFWQDFSRDLKIDRCFIPKNLLLKYDLSKENLERQENSAKFINCMSELYLYTGELFDRGAKLIKNLYPLRLKLEIAITLEGGKKILKKSEELGFHILNSRPHLSKIDYFSIVVRSIKHLWT